MPRAVLHLDDHGVLEGCVLLLGLVCVQRRCLADTSAAEAVALGEILRELWSDTPDHRNCAVLRALAGLPAPDETSASDSPATSSRRCGLRPRSRRGIATVPRSMPG